MKHLMFRLMPWVITLVLCSPQATLAAVSAEEFLAAKPQMIKLFGCGFLDAGEMWNTQALVARSAGLNLGYDSAGKWAFGTTTGKKTHYQKLLSPLEVYGVSFEEILFTNNDDIWAYTFKLASNDDLEKLKAAFKMKKQKPTVVNGDVIYSNLYPNTMAERQASVNPKKLTFTCRWRTELSDEVD